MTLNFNQKLDNSLIKLELDKDTIPKERKTKIDEIAQIINIHLTSKENLNLLFICTHNSRRSQLAQVWSHIAVLKYKLDEFIKTYSAGTEVTEMYSQTAAALQFAGINIQNKLGKNAGYLIDFQDIEPSIVCFSKRFDDISLPIDNRIAIMTCSEAEESCPFVPGTLERYALPYEDPKRWDDHPDVLNHYHQKSMEIAREMFYLISKIEKPISI